MTASNTKESIPFSAFSNFTRAIRLSLFDCLWPNKSSAKRVTYIVLTVLFSAIFVSFSVLLGFQEDGVLFAPSPVTWIIYSVFVVLSFLLNGFFVTIFNQIISDSKSEKNISLGLGGNSSSLTTKATERRYPNKPNAYSQKETPHVTSAKRKTSNKAPQKRKFSPKHIKKALEFIKKNEKLKKLIHIVTSNKPESYLTLNIYLVFLSIGVLSIFSASTVTFPLSFINFIILATWVFHARLFISIFANANAIIKLFRNGGLVQLPKDKLKTLRLFLLVSLGIGISFLVSVLLFVHSDSSFHWCFIILTFPLMVLFFIVVTWGYVSVSNLLVDFSKEFFRESLWLNTPFFHILWRKGNWYLTRLLYVMIPFILIVILGGCIVFSDGFRGTDASYYYFVEDHSNCYTILYVFLFMYFVNGIFVHYFNKNTDCLITKIAESHSQKKYKLAVYWTSRALTILYIMFVLGAIYAIHCARIAGSKNYWYHSLSKPVFALYAVITALSWILTSRLFISILINSITVFKLSRDNKIKFGRAERRDLFLEPVKKQLAASLGFGIYFLIAVGMILYSDMRAHYVFKMDFFVYELRWPILAIIILVSAFYFSTVIMGFIGVTDLLNDNSSGMVLSKKYHKIDTSSSGIFLLTALLPGIAALTQILTPLPKLIELFRQFMKVF